MKNGFDVLQKVIVPGLWEKDDPTAEDEAAVPEQAVADAVVEEGEPGLAATHVLPFPIVGIGGSAGAVEAFIDLFEHLPADTGMAFVVVMHLSATQESHMAEIVARHTAMPVRLITEGLGPERDTVYVLAPNAVVTMRNSVFHLEPRAGSAPFLPIDALFESLAREQKNYAIGVVLSGMDGDGALGLRAIKGEGGFSIVQTPESARYPDMPRSSIGMDHVDMVLSPDLIAKNLEGLGRRFGSVDWQRVEEGEGAPNEERHYGRIVRLLKGVSGVDYRLYKSTTIRRRITRRMLMHKIDTIADYVLFLQGNTGELRDLQEDILISVTRFFRDPEVFEALKKDVIPRIFENRESDRQVRVWVAGCATGEEVYSIAICLLEYLTGQSIEPSIQIFGTDASEDNIQKARLGVYPESIVNEVSPERLRRFFIKTEKGFQITKRLRDLCIFARQNLCMDPPFSRLDLVTCRNVLIYFGSHLQRQVITTFHYALRQDGYLLLGNSETIREFTDLFGVADRTHKIFQRIGDWLGRSSLSLFPAAHFQEGTIEATPYHAGEGRREVDLNRMTDRVILARFAPPVVVVDARMEILQSRGRTTPFIEMAQGAASLQLSRMTRDSIADQVTSAVARAIEHDLPVQADNLQILDGEQVRTVRLEVLPMHAAGSAGKYYLLVFLPQWDHGTAAQTPLPDDGTYDTDSDRTVGQLQHDLSSTKLYLQSLLDERDSRNQELISANEEIQSANEELQSTNEELETTKEELQSSNEELQTVNDELQNRNSVLTQASNDLSNLLNSVNLPVLMLSNELYIRHFTPQTQKLMSVRASDLGRPFGDIRLNLVVENLQTHLLEVLDTLAPQEMEVQDTDGRWYLLRIRPYRTTDNKIDGLVLVVVDIDQHRRSQQELRSARDFAASVIASIPLPLVVVNSQRKIYSLNDAFCTLTGMTRQAMEGRAVTDLVAGLWKMEAPLRSMLTEVQASDARESSFECENRQPDESIKTLLVRGRPLQPDEERFVLVTFEDITAHKEVQNLLKREGERLAVQVALTTRELDRSREELRALTDSLMTSQEEERRRLARELHDDVSQRMALLDLDCGSALQDLQTDPESARAKLEMVRAHVAEVSRDVRTLSHRLHPSIIEHLGPAAALESLLDEFAKRDGMLTTFFTEGVPAAIPIEVATGLYRITQEALRNVAKHAGRAHVKVSLVGEPGRLELQVADSGMGFDPEQHASGLGLISMKERARLIGATITIEAARRVGTRVHLQVPLN